MKFRNNENGFTEERTMPWLWTLFLGAFYLIFCGAWLHVVIWFFLAAVFFASIGPAAVVFMLVVNLFYALFATSIVRNSYLRKGWVELGSRGGTGTEPENRKSKEDAGDEKTCQFCAETIKRKALICKHCGKEQAPEVNQKSGRGVDMPPFSG